MRGGGGDGVGGVGGLYILVSVAPNPTAGGWKAEGGFHIAVGGTTGGREGVWLSICTVHMTECVCVGLRVCAIHVHKLCTPVALVETPVSHRACVSG